jgi:RluA family pseudouridine synthase
MRARKLRILVASETTYRDQEQRFVPPVRKYAWTTAGPLSAGDLTRQVLEHCGFDEYTWQRVLWHGGVHINRQRIQESRLPAQVPACARVVVYVFEREPELVEVSERDILLRGDGAVVVNKPAWLSVQGTRASSQLSLETQLKHLLACDWLTPVHRLDRQTSGALVCALNPKVAHHLHQQFEHRMVIKNYLAWVSPPPREAAWQVSGRMVQIEHPHHACFTLDESPLAAGRPSVTDLEVMEVCQDYAMVRARPQTGRTHQIRVHLAYGGTPIVADQLYGGPAGPLSAPRLMLHALSICIDLGEGATTITAEPPADFCEFSARARTLATSSITC